MKKIHMILVVLFSQVFFISESVQCAEIKATESGKCNLSPANNDSGWVITDVDEKA